MATPLATLTFESGTNGAALATGGVITAVNGTSTYSTAAAIHGTLGLTCTGATNSTPTFTVTKSSLGITNANSSNTVSYYVSPVTLPGGALQLANYQTAANAVIGQLRLNTNTSKFDIFYGSTISGASTVTWSTGTKYRLDVNYDGSANSFTVKIFVGSNIEGTTPDDSFTAAGNTGVAAFDHILLSPGKSSVAGCQAYLDDIRFYDGIVTPDPYSPGTTLALTGTSTLAFAAQGPGSVVHLWQGAPTTTGFRVTAHTSATTSLRLAVSTSSGMTSPTYFTGGAPDSAGYISIAAAGLAAGTRYYYQLEDTPPGGSGVLIGTVGRARTVPAGTGGVSHRVAFGSCITTNQTDGTALNDVVTWDPDLFVFMGDFDYSGDTSTDPVHQRQTYESQIAGTTGMPGLLRDVPWAYCTSDHEAGPDNGDSNNAYTSANITAYKQIVPTYSLADTRSPTVGRYQTWVIGRVRYILLDIRNTDRSPGANTDDSSKTMLGAVQKQWLKDQLVQPEPVKVIVSDVAWMGAPSLTNGADKWWSYDTERTEIANYINANNVKVVLVHGDTHALGVATPAANTWGGFPVYCASPMANTGGGRNLSTFTSYWNNSGGAVRAYGRLTVTDNGSNITFAYSGWDAVAGVQRVSQTDVFQLPLALSGSGQLTLSGTLPGAPTHVVGAAVLASNGVSSAVLAGNGISTATIETT